MTGRRTDDLDYRLAYLPILWDVGGRVAKRIDLPPLPKSGEEEPMNLDHLAQLATEATPGNWLKVQKGDNDWAFIAAANPSVVLALVEVARAAQKVHPAAWRQLKAILHFEWPEQSARVAVFADALAKLDNLEVTDG